MITYLITNDVSQYWQYSYKKKLKYVNKLANKIIYLCQEKSETLDSGIAVYYVDTLPFWLIIFLIVVCYL